MANWWEQDKIAVAEPSTLAVTPKVTQNAWYQNDEIVGSPLLDKKSPQFKAFALSEEGSGMLAAESPEIAAKIAAKEQPSRNDLKELGVSGWNAEERTRLSSLFRDAANRALEIPPTGIPEIAPSSISGVRLTAEEIAEDKALEQRHIQMTFLREHPELIQENQRKEEDQLIDDFFSKMPEPKTDYDRRLRLSNRALALKQTPDGYHRKT